METLFIPPNTTSHPAPGSGHNESLQVTVSKWAFFFFFLTSELYTKTLEALKANKETTMMDYWKLVTVHEVIDYVGNIKQVTINYCWENVWLDCVENFEGFEGAAEGINNSVKNIMHTTCK